MCQNRLLLAIFYTGIRFSVKKTVEKLPFRILPAAVRSPEPRRVAFDLKRIMRSLYRIDAFQETYFVIDSFGQLFEATAPDFTPLYRELETLEDLPANAVLPEDRLIS